MQKDFFSIVVALNVNTVVPLFGVEIILLIEMPFVVVSMVTLKINFVFIYMANFREDTLKFAIYIYIHTHIKTWQNIICIFWNLYVKRIQYNYNRQQENRNLYGMELLSGTIWFDPSRFLYIYISFLCASKIWDYIFNFFGMFITLHTFCFLQINICEIYIMGIQKV